MAAHGAKRTLGLAETWNSFGRPERGDVWEWPGLAYVLAGAVTAGLAYYGADLLTGAR